MEGVLSHRVQQAWVALLPNLGQSLLGDPAAQGTCEKHEKKTCHWALLTSEGPTPSAPHPQPAPPLVLKMLLNIAPFWGTQEASGLSPHQTSHNF